MRNYIKIISYFIAVSVACLMLSCMKQEFEAVPTSSFVSIDVTGVNSEPGAHHTRSAKILSRQEITDGVWVSVRSEDNPVRTSRNVTKGTNTTSSSFETLYSYEGFGAYAEKHGDAGTVLIDNSIFHKWSNPTWTTDNEYPWPDFATDFYAWAPKNVAHLSQGSKAFTYTTPSTNSAEGEDILVSKVMNVSEYYSQPLNMVFNHALCEVRFVTGSTMPSGKLTSLSISGIKMTGSYDFTTDAWTIPESSETGSISLDLSSKPVQVAGRAETGSALTSDTQTFFVIPQISTSGTKINIQFQSESDSAPQNHEIHFPENFEFQSGKVITIGIGEGAYGYVFDFSDSSNASIILTNSINDSPEQRTKLISLKYDSDIIEDWFEEDLEYWIEAEGEENVLAQINEVWGSFDVYKQKSMATYAIDELADNGESEIVKIQPYKLMSYTISDITTDFNRETLIVEGGVEANLKEDEEESIYPWYMHQYISFKGLAREECTGTDVTTNSYWAGGNGAWSPDDWSNQGVIDLSRMNVKKDNPSESINAFDMTTANCYVIRHAGHYKFPLVYGNAMKNGAVYEESYDVSNSERWDIVDNIPGNGGYWGYRMDKETFMEEAEEGCFLVPFVDCNGNPIISPFIETNTTDGLPKSDTNDYLSIGSSSILWQDNSNIITIDKIEQESVSFIGADGANYTQDISYLYFTVPQTMICQNNALLCVRDQTEKIIWSWHIWTTNNPSLLEEEAVVTDSFLGDKYYFHPMNSIGWIDNSLVYPEREDIELIVKQEDSALELNILINQPETAAPSGGTYYQFGRKDPIPMKGLVELGESPLAQGTIGYDDSCGIVNIQSGIQNPTTFYCGDDGFWVKKDPAEYDFYENLWSGFDPVYGETYPVVNNMIKTIYDPSPIGYKVPPQVPFIRVADKGIWNNGIDLYAGVNDSGLEFWEFWDEISSGIREIPDSWGHIFFAASGCRSVKEKGKLIYKGDLGSYWSCHTEHSISSSYYACQNYPTVSIWAEDRGFGGYNYGFSIRPILSERFANEPSYHHVLINPYENEIININW